MQRTLLFALVALGLAGLFVAGASATPTQQSRTHDDPALGITFSAPSDLTYVRAQPVSYQEFVQTTTALLSNYGLQPQQPPSRSSSDLLVEFRIHTRPAGVTFEDFVRRDRTSTPPRARRLTVDGRSAIMSQGTFQNGERILVYVDMAPGKVLSIQLFPSHSVRQAEFADIVSSVRFK